MTDEGFSYDVRRGDSLSRIAKRFGVRNWRQLYRHAKNEEFRRAHPNPDLIYPGDKLWIPERTGNRPLAPTGERCNLTTLSTGSATTDLAVRVLTHNGIPVSEATIEVVGCGWTLLTDMNGVADFGTVSSGDYSIVAEKWAYSPLLTQPMAEARIDTSVTPGTSRMVELELNPIGRVETKHGSHYDIVWDDMAHKITVVSKLSWDFDSDISAAECSAFKTQFRQSVLSKWNAHTHWLESQRPGRGRVLPPRIDIYFKLSDVKADEHFEVNVKRIQERAFVDNALFDSINVGLNDLASPTTIAHEYGHTLGLPDEYDSLKYGSDWCQARKGGYFEWTCGENWTHDDMHYDDEGALMNIGDQLGARYFVFVCDQLNEWTDHAYDYAVRPIP